MPLNFPASPADGDIYGGYIYVASAGAWQKIPGNIDASDSQIVLAGQIFR